MKKVLNKKNNHIILIAILFVQILFMIFYCDMKKGFFVDEIWSYGLANSYYHAQIWEDGALDSVEISPKMFKDYLTVNDGENFKFGSVIYNQTHDSHPPLFYMVLHMISSCFPGEFSKWFGLIPNLIYYLITIVFLYKIGRLVSKNKYFAYFPLVFYGFSIAAVNTVTYVRMYMLLTMWCMIFAYEHFKIILKKELKNIDILSIIIATFGGMFTHYYFVLFAFPIVVVQMSWMLVRKDWKMIGKYVVSGGGGGGCAIALYPTIIKNLTGSGVSHSQTAMQSMRNFSDWYVCIQRFWKAISDEMFGSMLWGITIVCIIGIAAYLITHIFWKMKIAYNGSSYEIKIEKSDALENIGIEIKREYYLLGDIIFCSMFVFIIVSKIAPYKNGRYIMNLFPLISLIFCYVLYCICRFWIKNKKKSIFAIVIILMFVGSLTYYANDPCYLYPEGENNIAISEQYSNTNCVYIYASSYVMLNEALELQNYDHLYQMYYKDIDKYISQISTGKTSNLVVYIDNVLDREYDEDGREVTVSTKKCLKKVQQVTGLEKSKELYQDEKAYAYLIYK